MWFNTGKLAGSVPEYRSDIPNISQKFVNFLKRDKTLRRNSFIIWNLGGRGRGKTALTFIILNLILLNNLRRIVQFFKAPPIMLKMVYKHAPRRYKGRFKIAKDLSQIIVNSILVIDEGLLGLNAKEALRSEMKRISKFLSKSRHPNNIIIVNSVNLNILSEFRDMVDIIVYKHLNYSFINNNRNRDPILVDYMDKIMNLKDTQGLLISNYKRFNYNGIIDLHLKKYCNWFNDEISRYHKFTNPDVERDEKNRERAELLKIAELAIIEKGSRFDQSKGSIDLSGWLDREFPDLFYKHNKHIKRIFSMYVNIIKDKKERDRKKRDKENKIDSRIIDDFRISRTETLNKMIKKFPKSKKLERDFGIRMRIKDGEKQYKIAEDLGLEDSNISKINKKMIIFINNIVGNEFANYYGEKLKKTGRFKVNGVKIDGSSGMYDIRAIDKSNNLFYYSIKVREVGDKNKKINPSELNPEIRYCKNAVSNPDFNKVIMVFVAYDPLTNRVFEKDFDYLHPKPVNLPSI